MIYWASNLKKLKDCFAVNLLAFLFLLIQSSAAGDQKAESTSDSPEKLSTAPTEISSDSMDFDMEERTAIFSGNVHVVDDELRLDSDKMVVQFDKNNKLQKIEAVGNVVINSEGNMAKSGQAAYDVKNGTVVLSIEPVLMQGDNRVIGAEKIIFSRVDEKFTTVGGDPQIIFFETDDKDALPDLFKQRIEKEE